MNHKNNRYIRAAGMLILLVLMMMPVTSWGAARSRLTPEEVLIYDALRPHIEAVAQGSCSKTKFILTFLSHEQDVMAEEDGVLVPVKSAGIGFTAQQLGVDSIYMQSLSGKQYISAAARSAMEKKITNMSDRVLVALTADMPMELYWFHKQKGISMEYQYVSGSQGDSTQLILSELTCMFHVSGDYSGNDAFTVNAAAIASAGIAIREANRIASSVNGRSVDEKLEYFKTMILQQTEYQDNPGDSGKEYELISVFDGDPGTRSACEAYAKAFQYLCILAGMGENCMTVNGVLYQSQDGRQNNSEIRHSWNMVRKGNKNYLVDLTNCDAGMIGDPDFLYMRGYNSGSVMSGYRILLPENTVLVYRYDPSITELLGEAGLTLAEHMHDIVTVQECEDGRDPETADSYDEVEYCAVCFVELSRKHIVNQRPEINEQETDTVNTGSTDAGTATGSGSSVNAGDSSAGAGSTNGTAGAGSTSNAVGTGKPGSTASAGTNISSGSSAGAENASNASGTGKPGNTVGAGTDISSGSSAGAENASNASGTGKPGNTAGAGTDISSGSSAGAENASNASGTGKPGNTTDAGTNIGGGTTTNLGSSVGAGSTNGTTGVGSTNGTTGVGSTNGIAGAGSTSTAAGTGSGNMSGAAGTGSGTSGSVAGAGTTTGAGSGVNAGSNSVGAGSVGNAAGTGAGSTDSAAGAENPDSTAGAGANMVGSTTISSDIGINTGSSTGNESTYGTTGAGSPSNMAETEAGSTGISSERTENTKVTSNAKWIAAVFPMKIGQKVKAVMITELGKTEYIKSCKSSNTRILKVSSTKKGTVTFAAGKKKGTVTITAVLNTGRRLMTKVKVSSRKVKTTDLTVSDIKTKIKAGKKMQLKVSRIPITSVEKISFKTSNKDILSVNAKGLVKAKKAGTAVITVQAGKVKKKIRVKVIRK